MGGWFHRRLYTVIRRMWDAGLVPHYILWHQGEGNAGPTANYRQYKKNLYEVIRVFRAFGIDSPFLVAVATYCGGGFGAGAKAIQFAQRNAVNPLLGIFPGPDTDTNIGPSMRYDNCHMTEPVRISMPHFGSRQFKRLRPKNPTDDSQSPLILAFR